MQMSRMKLPPDLAGLSRDEWVEIVKQARFSELDREIIKHCIILGRSQIETGVYVDRDRKTVCRRMSHIIKRAQEVAEKLNTKKETERE